MSDTHGYLRRDDALHWYLVPESQVEDFDDAFDQIEGKEYMEAAEEFDEFESYFGELRVDGIQDFKVVMPE